MLKPQNPAHSARMRIFTPGRELPSPAIRPSAQRSCSPSAHTASQRRRATSSSSWSRRSAPCASVCVCAPARRRSPNSTLRSCRRSPARRRPRPAGGCAGAAAARDRFREPHRAAHGRRQHVRLRSCEQPRGHRQGAHQRRAIGRNVPGDEIDGVYLYTRQCVHNGSAFHARMFAPQLGVPEDPATGSAAVCLAGWCTGSTGCPTARISGSSSRATRWGARAPSCLP